MDWLDYSFGNNESECVRLLLDYLLKYEVSLVRIVYELECIVEGKLLNIWCYEYLEKY